MIDLERIAEDYPEALKADGFDEALIGVAHRAGSSSVLAYSIPKCLEILEKRDGMTPEGAQEFFDFNVVDAFMGEHTPVFLDVLDTDCQKAGAILKAAENFDWGQPSAAWAPCFHLGRDGHFCGRAPWWDGHRGGHPYTPLATLLKTFKESS